MSAGLSDGRAGEQALLASPDSLHVPQGWKGTQLRARAGGELVRQAPQFGPSFPQRHAQAADRKSMFPHTATAGSQLHTGPSQRRRLLLITRKRNKLSKRKKGMGSAAPFPHCAFRRAAAPPCRHLPPLHAAICPGSPSAESRTVPGRELVGLFVGYSGKLVPDSAQTI